MNLSHSKLSTIISCPMTYYLAYEEKITPLREKTPLKIGSAVHWGIEHETANLDEFFETEEYNKEKIIAEGMVEAYLKQRPELFTQLLGDCELLEEFHELTIKAKLPSNRFPQPHEFVGIIDLLLLTDKGFIIVDYKTSSQEPDWDKYLDQIYRYIFLLQSEFPDTPVYKVGIINLRKTSLRQKKNENDAEFLNRIRYEYAIDSSYINYHEYPVETLDKTRVEDYMTNLIKMSDAAQEIVDNKFFFINYANANGPYGKSDYWDIFYKTPDAHMLYKIQDPEITEDGVKDYRVCEDIDLMTIDNSSVMNHFDKYKKEYEKFGKVLSEKEFNEYLKKMYICNDKLLKNYRKLINYTV